jgi:hypothetical protein
LLAPLVVRKPMDCDEADAWDLLEPLPPDSEPPPGNPSATSAPRQDAGANAAEEGEAGEGGGGEGGDDNDDVSLVIVVVLSTWSGGAAPATAVRW